MKLAEELARVGRAALRRYKQYPNVLGISTGTKYVKRIPTDNHASIQFYVRKKRSPEDLKKKELPKFVYGRFENGKVNRRRKFTTDVIEVGRSKRFVALVPPFFRASA